MLARILPAPILGAFSLLLHTINTFFWIGPILLAAIIKLIVPVNLITKGCNLLLNFFASSWISVNTAINQLTKNVNWQITLPQDLSTNDWYLVIANHKSWVDIFALQQSLNRQVPFLKFFLKKELFWVPVLGLAWWALDFPFMKRYSKSYIKKNPHKKGEDFKTTKKACEKFKSIPISIMNFAEGTRFTQQKQQRQGSPYQNLLKPKSGGIGYVLTLMGNEINQVLDVTINYPDFQASQSQPTFWDFLCGKVTQINVTAKLKPIPDNIKGDYINDAENRKLVQQWVNQLWQEKDQELTAQASAQSS
ncbi:acyltransferase [Aliikangiella sp. IMCC44632]